MHLEVRQFIERAMVAHPVAFRSASTVLEGGSFDVNGTPRKYFPVTAEYVGVDWRAGKGVDVVSLLHEYKEKPDGYFDFVVSTEMLEHDPVWRKSVARMMALLCVGGSLLITCAGPGRHAHDVATAPREGYYENPTGRALVEEINACGSFAESVFQDDAVAHDLRFFGWQMRRTPSTPPRYGTGGP